MKREYLFGGLVVLLIGSGIGWNLSRTIDSPLSALKWANTAPAFIVSNEEKQDNYTGPLLIGLQSGKTQFISGDWTLRFHDSDLFGYGNFAKSTSTDVTSTSIFSPQSGPFLLRVTGELISILEMKHLPGDLDNASESQNGSYIGVRVKNSQDPYCVIETTEDAQNRPCTSVPVSSDDRVVWNSAKDHELVIESATGSLSTIDVWDGKDMKKSFVTKIDDQKKYNQLKTNFPATPAPLEMKRWWYFTAVRTGDGWKTFRIPASAHVTVLSDNQHLLIQEKNQLSVLEVSTRKIAPLYKEDGIGNQQILTRNPDDGQL